MVEKNLNEYIIKKHKSLRNFATATQMPYSTIENILKHGIGNSSAENVFKICNALNIDVDKLCIEHKVVEKRR